MCSAYIGYAPADRPRVKQLDAAQLRALVRLAEAAKQLVALADRERGRPRRDRIPDGGALDLVEVGCDLALLRLATAADHDEVEIGWDYLVARPQFGHRDADVAPAAAAYDRRDVPTVAVARHHVGIQMGDGYLPRCHRAAPACPGRALRPGRSPRSGLARDGGSAGDRAAERGGADGCGPEGCAPPSPAPASRGRVGRDAAIRGPANRGRVSRVARRPPARPLSRFWPASPAAWSGTSSSWSSQRRISASA